MKIKVILVLAAIFFAGPALCQEDTTSVDTIVQENPDTTVADTPSDEPAGEKESVLQKAWAFLKAHGLPLLFGLLGLIEVIVRLTPTKRDDAWFQWLRDVIDKLIPNLRTGGGRFTR